jgi:hypothetical protein
MNSYIAFHEKNGIYLGVFGGVALFSNTELAFSSKAIRFNSEEEIRNFFMKSVPKLADQIQAIPITTKSTDYYVDVVDIIKSGHTKHTDSMIDNMLMPNENIH